MRIIFVIVLSLVSGFSFAQSAEKNELILKGHFKLEKGHIGHNVIYVIDIEKKDTVKVYAFQNDKLLQKGVYSMNLPINKNYAVVFASDGYEDIWKPLTISVSTTLPKNVKSIETQHLAYNVHLNMGHNKETFIAYNKETAKFEIKSK